MPIRKLSGLFFILLIFGLSIFICINGGGRIMAAFGAKEEQLQRAEAAVSQTFPGTLELQQFRVALNYLSGRKEQNGVYIAGDMLMKDVQPSNQNVINSNINSVLQLAKSMQRPTYLMLIPTSCAIVQSKVPYNDVAPLYSQRQLIDDVYRRISGNVTAIDVYPVLFNHQTEPIYYHTHNAPTGLGGYYIYTAVAKKFGLTNVHGLEQFSVEHIDTQFYGDLYKLSPFHSIEPDRVSAYQYADASGTRRGYTVTHYDTQGQRRYFTLYPRFKKELDGSLGTLLGGVSPIVDIQVGKRQNKNLLVIGDATMQSYLPFLLAHYGRVTFIDAARLTPQMMERIDVEDYGQLLIAFSVDSFIEARQLERTAELFRDNSPVPV